MQPQTMTTNNANQQQFGRQHATNDIVGLRSISSSSLQPAATTVTTSSSSTRVQTSSSSSSNDNNTPQFVAAGGRLSAAANQPRRRQQQSHQNNNNNNIANSAVFNSAEELMTNPYSSLNNNDFTSLTNALTDETTDLSRTSHSGARFKRSSSSSSLMNEFELSFGEILPKLRSLKLESFLDLSQLSGADKPTARPATTSGGNSLMPRRSATVRGNLIRPKRDDSEFGLTGSAAAAPTRRVVDGPGETDTLIALESSDNVDNANQPLVLSSADDNNHHAGGTLSASSSQEAAPAAETALKTKQISLILQKLFSKLTHLETLRLESNDIPYWPDQVLQDSRQSLLRLYLYSNNIRHLGRDSFANLTSLGVLDLSTNQIRQLSGDLFRDLKNLHNIKVSRNLIRSLPTRLLLAQQRSERTISTNGNRLGDFPMHVDVDFSKNRYLNQLALDTFVQQQPSPESRQIAPIVNLNLSDCSFTDQLPSPPTTGGGNLKSPFESLFGSMPDLISISLNGNKLNKLLAIGGLFARNYRLKELDFSSNRISALSGNLFNSNASHIVHFRLDNNQIAELPDQLLFYLRNLRTLSLSNNKLSQLPANMFFQNPLIERLDLSHNQLIRLNAQLSGGAPFGHAANLKTLNFAHNNLSDFHQEIFTIEWQLYTSLRDLDLSHNRFAGQISMPILFTVAERMSVNLGWNQIESIDMEDLTEHERLIDQYVTESQPPPTSISSVNGQHQGPQSQPSSSSSSSRHQRQQQQQAKVISTVQVELADNPIVCDCLLEPLITYAKRVDAITNPSLAAPGRGGASFADLPMPSSPRYSVLSDSELSSSSSGHHNRNHQQQHSSLTAEPPQLLYKFNLNGASCAKPYNLRAQHLSQVSRADLLCPISDESLCPRQCECFYQSISRTAIVDCDNRQLTSVPEQLTNSTNFAHVNVDSSFSSSSSSSSMGGNITTIIKSFDNITRIIIRLNNNLLRSMEPLSRLFEALTVMEPAADSNPKRFVRLASSAVSDARGESLEDLTEDVESPSRGQVSASPRDRSAAATPQAQPLVAAAVENQVKKSIVSPVIIGRNMHAASSAAANRQRSRRETTTTAREGEPIVNSIGGADAAGSTTGLYDESINVYDQDTSGGVNPAYTGAAAAAPSSSIEEGAGVMRKKKPFSQPIYCELYLDNNLIDSIPESFLEFLDRFNSSSLRPNQALLHQGALPNKMEEPPNHAKIDHHLMEVSDHEMFVGNNNRVGPLAEPLLMASSSGSNNGMPESLRPLKPEQKAAVLESVRLNQQQLASVPSEQLEQVSISPSLLVLSLKRNNLATLSGKILHRLGKLIHSSNTKIFLGHNPFNCSENFSDATSSPSSTSNGGGQGNSIAGPETLGVDDGMASELATPGGGEIAPPLLTPTNCPIGQFKSWLLRYRSSVGDLDELYCVHMPAELSDKLQLATTNSSPSSRSRQQLSPAESTLNRVDHLWPSDNSINGSLLMWKKGFAWNSSLLSSGAKLIDLDKYDLCPYSRPLDPLASSLLSPGNQQILISVAIVFILISLCLLMMLVYFGDTQTILAFTYIHMNPIYKCLRLNESHLDGDKLYDAFVSYTDADRDIVMALVDKLERQSSGEQPTIGTLNRRSKLSASEETANNNSDRSQEALVGGGGIDLNRRPDGQQTLNRSSSRITMDGPDKQHDFSHNSSQFGGSAPDVKNLNSPMATGGNSSNKPYRLCIHERDWLPGHLISWNIVNSVQNSRRTILILSKDFIKSTWFQVEFQTAYYQMIEDKIDRLIVIVRGELPPKQELDKNLAFLLTTKTYLKWGDKWFWERLHYALPHRSGPPALASATVKQRTPLKQHHHRCSPQSSTPTNNNKKPEIVTTNNNNNGWTSSSDLMLSPSSNQKPLILSSIGKDCSNLLLAAHHNSGSSNHINSSASLLRRTNNNPDSTPIIDHSSSSSSSQNSNHTRFSSGASSFFSGGVGSSSNHTATTSNDLLSASPEKLSSSTTRLTIGPTTSISNNNSNGGGGSNQSTALTADSGRVTATLSSSSSLLTGGVTNIMLDGSGGGGGQQLQQASSKARQKKQEKLHNFVEQTIADRFNLSEL